MATRNENGERLTRAQKLRLASRERREMQRQDLRQAILDAAAALFLEQGYEQFSMRQIAERIGYSATTIYRHFENKDDLLFAVVDRGFERFGAALREAAAGSDDPGDRLTALGHAYVRFGLENPTYYQLMFMQRTDYLTKTPEGSFEPRFGTFLILQRAVEEAIAAGVLNQGDARIYGNAIWSVVHGVVALAITMAPEVGFDVERTLTVALDMTVDGLRKR
jgi:AcrR family transcriptional regulator